MPPFALPIQRREELQLVFERFTHKKKQQRKPNADRLDFHEMVYLLNSIGVFLNKRDLIALRGEFDERGDFSFDDLLELGSVVYTDDEIERHLRLALLQLDAKKTGFIPTNVLRLHLWKLGTGLKLDPEETELFLMDCDPMESGEISVDTFVKMVLTQ